MWSPSNDAEIPEYYRQWAAAIGRLRPEEQMRTLAQMSEEDRLIVQRLNGPLLHAGIGRTGCIQA